jgi:hypothetical protein
VRVSLRGALLATCLALPSGARAQEVTDTTAEPQGTDAPTEGPDATRLDVERLPIEAIPITRDLYAHGFFLEAVVGGRGWIGGIGRLSSPGPYGSLAFGYEIFDWLFVSAVGEFEIHETAAPTPPGTAVFEILHALGDVKVQVNPTAEVGLWLSGQVGICAATTDVLALYGLQNASSVGLTWGGELGVDYHWKSRHPSIGIRGGVRGAPSFDGFGDLALAAQGAAYLRYVF